MTNTTSSDVAHACVVLGPTDISYRCAGRGEAVVLLAADPATASALLARLPRRLRVLAPDVSMGLVRPETGSGDFDEWLHGFLDVVGIPRTSLITDDFFAAATLGFAMLDPERVYGVVLLTRSDAEGQMARRPRMDKIRGSGTSLLVTPCELENGELADDVVHGIVEFLDGLV